MCRHCSRYFAPTAEGVALFCGSGFGGDILGISNLGSFVHLAVHLVDEFVSVHCKATRHLHIVCWHRGGYFAPAAEGVALFFGSSFGGDILGISNLSSLVHFAVHLVDELVNVGCKATRHYHIVRRHGGRYFAPAAEGVALLGGSGLGGDSFAIDYRYHVER